MASPFSMAFSQTNWTTTCFTLYKGHELPLTFNNVRVDEYGEPESQDEFLNRRFAKNPKKVLKFIIHQLKQNASDDEFVMLKTQLTNDLKELEK